MGQCSCCSSSESTARRAWQREREHCERKFAEQERRRDELQACRAVAAAAPDHERDNESRVEALQRIRPYACFISLLDKDALGSVFGFLTLSELCCVLQVSHSSQATALGMKPLGLPKWLRHHRELWPVIASRLGRRHLTHLTFNSDQPISTDLCRELVERMHLRGLSCGLALSSADPPAFAFSQGLETLELSFTGSGDRPSVRGGSFNAVELHAINAAIESVGSLARLRMLTLTFLEGSALDASISLAPLAQMHSLAELKLSMDLRYSSAHIDELRNLHSLTRLTFHSSLEQLRELFRQPYSLNLVQLDSCLRSESAPDGSVLEEDCPILLPSTLTTLRSTLLRLRRLDFLATLPNLTTIVWCLSARVNGVDHPPLMALMDGLKLLKGLTSLSLSGARLNSAQLTEALREMRSLREVHFVEFAQLDSLAFLSSIPCLASSLRVLELVGCQNPVLRSGDVVAHIVPLLQLEILSMKRCFEYPLEGGTQEQLRVPSALMPRLRYFEYEWELPDEW
jgi:hypothetical protein